MRLPVLLTVVAVTLAACGGAAGDATSDGAGGGAAGGTALRAVPLAEALQSPTSGPQLITGLLIDDGSGWRLCTAVAESYPPQCGGDSVAVEGVDPADHALTTVEGVQWQESATVYGELSGDTLTVTGPASAA